MDLKQSQKLSQKLTLTPLMRQSLRMLELPLLELRSYIESQIEENPTLKQENTTEHEQAFKEKIERIIENEKGMSELPIGESHDEINKKREYKESLISKTLTLEEHLLRQLRISSLRKRMYKLGECILTNLDENGYLNLSLDEIVKATNKKTHSGEDVDKPDVEKALEVIYRFDPPGVAAKNLKECLLIQLKLKNRDHCLAYTIISRYLPDLIKGKNDIISKKLKVTLSDVEKALKEISTLSPKPGKAFETTITQVIAPSVPDVIVEKADDKLEVIINNIFLPKLRVSNYYLNLLKSKDTPEKTKKYIQEKINASLALIRSLSQRESTIQKIVQNIIEVQKEFFVHGHKSSIKPLTHREIAKLVKRNESTISRVVNSKYMKTPYGTFRLSYFFNTSLKTTEGKNISQESVKHHILDIINEEKNRSLKDSAIVKILHDEGIKIARRTIAKYRKELNIPAYYQRKNKQTG